MTLALNEVEIAWIAGLLEGEGSFGLDLRSKKRYKVSTAPAAPYMKISMVDEDVIARLSHLLNKTYFSPRRKTSTGKTVYILHVGDRETLEYLLPRLLPYFGARRTQRVQECIDALDAWKIWYQQGGRSEMAKQGPSSKKKTTFSSRDKKASGALKAKRKRKS